jgi:C-terminal processing protease CtpA/Prc
VRERYLERPDHVPFAFRWIDARMVVTDAPPGSALQRGDVLERVGAVRSARLLQQLMPFARADGGNDAKRRALMEVRPGERYPEFDLHRNLLHPNVGPLDLTVRRQEETLRVSVETVTPAVQARSLAAEDAKQPTFAIVEGIGIMRFRTWAFYNSDFDWRQFVDAAIDQAIVEKARGLILDNRGNEGGLDVGHHVLERLIAAPIDLPVERRRVRYRKTPTDLDPYLDTWDQSFRDWGDRATGPADDGFYELRDDAVKAAILSPRGKRFSPPFAILTDAANSSATFRFAEIVRRNKLGPLVGAATGGSRRGINGGAYFFLRLPNSRIEIDLPLIGYFPVGPTPPDTGLEPDIFAPWTLEGVRTGEDAAMAAARAHLLTAG